MAAILNSAELASPWILFISGLSVSKSDLSLRVPYVSMNFLCIFHFDQFSLVGTQEDSYL